MRTELLSAIRTTLSSLNQFAVSEELPWQQNGTPLYLKNMKRVYVDREETDETVLISTFSGDIYANDVTVLVYLAVDAKNPPSQLDTAIQRILAAKNATGVVNSGVESDYTQEQQEDVLIYTFEFRTNIVK
jgi:hypothetical protein